MILQKDQMYQSQETTQMSTFQELTTREYRSKLGNGTNTTKMQQKAIQSKLL